MKTKFKIILPLMVVLTATACSKKDKDKVTVPPPLNNEVEVITTLTLNFTDSAGVQPSTHARFRDPDGDGGKGPDIHDTIRLAKNTVYLVSITILNETAKPVDTVSKEILKENMDHLFCFTVKDVDVSIKRTDTDGTYEVGLQSKWRTGNAGNGTVEVTLKHQPGLKNGSCDPGETDVDVTYVTQIQ